ncbi:hypothetical protein BJF93_05480 [Xaviernesmea oryzae]|uniref:PRC-barrel domain-containing protein n=1 Tax=Xaviernesmea oryzae TaxID=464029 RepID=A0A1Q9AS14_9HYPH|nr:PRC-barrel domain-containing protein [Xaviernesmea oryzae]OLP58085.1 hypothetical protein BJF93_05480 [Xaviernesmea oryzae]SEL83270.1 Sporulation protein YlmC, PRC-barrel domain family [Xaviernesmea oryzae]
MIRVLLASTVLAAGFAMSTLSLHAQTPAPQAGAVVADPANPPMLASNVIGKTVYTGVDEEGEAIGKVKDVVMNAAGAAQALVVGVGGFLGIGEKDVAVAFDRVSWSDREGEQILVVAMSRDDLKAAPAFKRDAIMDPAATTNDAAAKPTTPRATPESEATTPAGSELTETGTPVQPGAPAAQATTTTPTLGTTPDMTDPDAPPPAETAAEPQLRPVDPSLISTTSLIGTPVKVADDSEIGKVGDVILNREGKLDAYVIDVGGFLGIGEKPVAMSARDIQIMADARGKMTIYSPFTKAQLEKQPRYDANAYKRDPRPLVLAPPAE